MMRDKEIVNLERKRDASMGAMGYEKGEPT